MTLRHLRIFVTVCETGSATVAGERLYLAQPSVSLAISELEKYYGIKLFDRIAKRLHITDSGKQFLQYAAHIVELFDKLEDNVRQFESAGILRVGTSITVGNYLLPACVKAFELEYPNMKISAFIENSKSIEEKVLSNQIDLAIIEGVSHNSYLIAKTLKDDELVLICGVNHPFAHRNEVDITEVKDERLIMREKGSAGREIVDSLLQSHDMEIEPLWQSISTQAIVRAVKEGIGISILPRMLIEDGIERNEIKSVKIRDIPLNRKFTLIYHKNKYISQSMKAFINICLKN